MEDLSLDIGETKSPPLILEGQLLMMDAQLMEHCSMEIMNIYRIFGHVVAEIIRASIGNPSFEATSGDPL